MFYTSETFKIVGNLQVNFTILAYPPKLLPYFIQFLNSHIFTARAMLALQALY